MADFNANQGDIQGGAPNTTAPRDQGGAPPTGFSDSTDPQDESTEPDFGPGPGIPGNRNVIR